MRVAYVLTRCDDLGGVQVHVRDLSETLRDRGHQVLVLGGGDGVLAGQLRHRRITVKVVAALGRDLRPWRDLVAFFQLRSELRSFEPDLISTHSTKAGVLGRLAGRSLGIPTVFTAHGWLFDVGSRWMRWLYGVTEWMMAHLCARVITVCERDRLLALQRGIASSERIVTIHNAMQDVTEEQRADPARSPPRIIMVGRFMDQKDQDTLLWALSELKDVAWTLDLVGSGPRFEEVKGLAGRLALVDRVRFLGLRTDVPRLLAKAQVFVLTSRWEGLPRSILEAMRAGLPTVATDVGGVREAVAGDETGYLVPAGDTEALRARLRTLLSSADLRTRMGQMARRRYEARFTFDRLVETTEDVYQQVLYEVSSEGSSERRKSSC